MVRKIMANAEIYQGYQQQDKESFDRKLAWFVGAGGLVVAVLGAFFDPRLVLPGLTLAAIGFGYRAITENRQMKALSMAKNPENYKRDLSKSGTIFIQPKAV
jgi:hypothetical protein